MQDRTGDTVTPPALPAADLAVVPMFGQGLDDPPIESSSVRSELEHGSYTQHSRSSGVDSLLW